LTAAPHKITASASLGDLLTLHSLSAEIAVTNSLPTLTSLHSEAHIDFPSTTSLPATTSDIRLDLADLTLTPEGPRSSSPQSLHLSNLSTTRDNSSATVDSLITSLRPDTLLSKKRIDSLLVSGVQLKIDLADLQSNGTEKTAAPQENSPPPWHGLNIAELSVTDSSIETTPDTTLGIPGATASFAVTTTATNQDNSTYRTTVDNLRLNSTTTTLATVRTITLDADPTSLWTRNHIARLAVDGVNLTVGQDLLDATKPTAPTTTATATATTAPAPESPAWTLGELTLSQSTVIIDDLVPGLPPLPLAISTTLTDIPLSTTGMEAASRLQSVTVSNARLRSRLNPLLDVARFDDVTLHFTFHGLVRQEIDRITIEHPVLFVGEHLFWYVDYFRKFETPTTTPTVTEENPAPGWDVKTVEANNGELVLAPKGSPLTELPKLPFSGKTSIVDSQLSFAIDSDEEPGQDINETRPLLSLSVPEGDYPLKSLNLGLEIDLKGLRGDIAFNLPIKQRTNNLVQTLYADELWFKNIGAKEVYLAVTYDQQGIYAKFGGEAYGGYAEGAFNLYNDSAYSWDGWVAGTTIALSPLTTALTPEYLE
ncbi:MAG: hypothetical protein P8J87_12205, partial [Verrucomicrobiales bacterium]|nr:hypothetical protein [Verrucomicrobiales bacterium]